MALYFLNGSYKEELRCLARFMQSESVLNVFQGAGLCMSAEEICRNYLNPIHNELTHHGITKEGDIVQTNHLNFVLALLSVFAVYNIESTGIGDFSKLLNAFDVVADDVRKALYACAFEYFAAGLSPEVSQESFEAFFADVKVRRYLEEEVKKLYS